MMKLRLKSAYNLGRQWMNHSLVRQYGSNTAWMVSARIYWSISGILTGILAARVLGPDNWGIFNYALAFVGIPGLLSTLNVEPVAVRQLVKFPDKKASIMGELFLFRLFSFLIMILTLLLALRLTNQNIQIWNMALILALGYTGYILQPIYLYFIALILNKYIALSSIIACTIYAIIRLTAILLDSSLYWYAWAETGQLLTGTAALIYFYMRHDDRPFRWKFKISGALKLLKPAILLSLSGFISFIYVQTDILMLKYMVGTKAVGYYSIGTKISEHWLAFSVILCSIFFPAIVSASQISTQAYTKQLHRLYFLVFWLMLALAALTILFSHPFIYLLYGREYLPAIIPLVIYICSLPFFAIFSVFVYWTVNEGMLKTNAAACLTGAILNIIFNLFAIPLFGTNGAALSTVAAVPLGLLVPLSFSRQGRSHLQLLFRALFSLPSFKLGEHEINK